MKRIFVPTAGANSWQQLLADPVKHWKPGASAHALATTREAAGGLPDEGRQEFALVQAGIPNPLRRPGGRWFVGEVDMAIFAYLNGWGVGSPAETIECH